MINNLENLLLDDEYLVWYGKPKAKRALRTTDFFVLPFAAVYLVVLWFVLAGRVVISSNKALLISFLAVWLIVGFYAVFGKIIVRAFALRKSIYCITNKRVFIYSWALFKRINKSKVINKNGSTGMRYWERSAMNKKAQITQERSLEELYDISVVKNLYGGLDIRFVHSIIAQKIENLVFENVKEAELVKDIIFEIKEREKYQNNHNDYTYGG